MCVCVHLCVYVCLHAAQMHIWQKALISTGPISIIYNALELPIFPEFIR